MRSRMNRRPDSTVEVQLEILHAMHIAPWERDPAGVLRPLGLLPAWLTAHFPALADEGAELARELPFLESFLAEAEHFWQQRSGTTLKSDPWTQLDANEDACVLEATAVVLPSGRELLLLALLGAEFASKRQVLQEAREQKLAYEDLARVHEALVQSARKVQRLAEERRAAIELLRKAREELETGVAERTVALTDLTERLQREVAEHSRTNAELVKHQGQLRAMAERILVTEAEERRRVAEFVHDQIGQNLAAVKLKLGAARRAGDTDAVTRLEEIGRLIDAVVNDTRSVTAELGTPALYELGLEEALRDLVERFEVAHGVAARFEDDGADKPLADSARLFVFQAVGEMLHNVLKHSEAREVVVAMRREGRGLVVSVKDAGVGFDARGREFRLTPVGGFGLFNIRERALHLGGNCHVRSTPGHGTEVVLHLPLASSD